MRGKENIGPTGDEALYWHHKSRRELLDHSWEIELENPFTNQIVSALFTPSRLTEQSPFSNPDVEIKLLPVEELIRHEEFLEEGLLLVSFRKNGFSSWNDAPIAGARDKNGNIIVIDGSTRLTRAEFLTQHIKTHYREAPHPPLFPVQIIDINHKQLKLEIWEEHHPVENKLTKNQVLEMALSGNHAMPKQTKFGAQIKYDVYPITETQGEVIISAEDFLGFSPPKTDRLFWSWLMA